MFLRELIWAGEEYEVAEGATPIFGKTGNKVVRKFRCTSGSRKGRIVAKPGTCTAPKNVKAMKKTRRSKGKTLSIKANRTKRTNSASVKLGRLNTGSRRRLTPRKRRGSSK
jgi:hypothetical protein